MYNWITWLVTSTSEQQFIAEAVAATTVNRWEQASEENRAIKAYAAEKKLKASPQLLDDIAQTELGVKGWADKLRTPTGEPQEPVPKPKGMAKTPKSTAAELEAKVKDR